MLFNSPEFVVFLVAIFSLYWVLPSLRMQNRLLLVGSYIFYGFWSWKFLGLIVISTLVDYVCGMAIGGTDNVRRRRRILYASLVTNLGILGAFKYANFFISETQGLLTALGFQVNPFTLEVILPIGISFYTFQSLSYTIDIYRGKLKPTRNFLDFALFVSFFPQLVAGPIERATNLLPQVQNPRRFSLPDAASGVQLMVWGMFKKVMIADNLAPFVDQVYGNPTAYSGSVLFTATVFFAFQIYCDFSGYSDIARGCARTLGFDIIVNFNLPYFSRNPVEFWERWHISLSKWFQDYLYFPMAMHYMRKGGWLAKYKAHIIAMTLIGFWHGANWTFVVFGFYWGMVIVLYLVAKERLTGLFEILYASEPGLLQRIAAPLSVLVMFVLVCIGWILFRADSMADFVTVTTHMLSPVGATEVYGIGVWKAGTLWLLVGGLYLAEAVYRSRQAFAETFLSQRWVRVTTRYALLVPIMVSYAVAQGTGAQPFIYFQF